jgi:hypothetical protein
LEAFPLRTAACDVRARATRDGEGLAPGRPATESAGRKMRAAKSSVDHLANQHGDSDIEASVRTGTGKLLSQQNPIKPKLLHELYISGILLLVAGHFALNFSRNGIYLLHLYQYLDLRETLPFQYRLLMVPVFKALISFLDAVHVQTFFTNLPPYLATSEALAYYTINVIAFFCTLQIFRRITFVVFKSKKIVACSVFLFCTIAYLTFVLNPIHPFIMPYDLPSLAFIQLGTLFSIRGRWNFLIALFIIATMNRETTFILVFFLVFSWCFHQRGGRQNGTLITAVTLSAIWVLIKLTLFLAITGDGTSDIFLGGISAWRIIDNLNEFAKPWLWPSLLLNLLPFAILAVFLTGRLRSGREWHLTAIIGYAALFPVGLVTEFRAFADLSGFFAVSLTLILCEYDVFMDVRDQPLG